MKKINTFKRFLAFLLAISMIISLSPSLAFTVFATDGEEVEETVIETVVDQDATTDALQAEDEQTVTDEAPDGTAAESSEAGEEVSGSSSKEDILTDEGSETEELTYTETADSGDPYIRANGVSKGSKYVIAYEEDGTYYVVTNSGGNLSVTELGKLTTTTVDETMLWEVSGTSDFAISNSGRDLTVSEEGGIGLDTGDNPYAWSYTTGTYLDYTTDLDKSYAITIVKGVLSITDDDFDNASGCVLLYKASSGITLKAGGGGNSQSHTGGVYTTYSTEKSNDSAYTVFVSTDRHTNGDALRSVVSAAEGYVESTYNTSIDKTVHGGDLVDSGDVSSAVTGGGSGLAGVNAEYRSILKWMAADGSDNFYTYGNSHDSSVTTNAKNNFLDSGNASGSSSPTRDSGAETLSDWAYVWGIDTL